MGSIKLKKTIISILLGIIISVIFYLVPIAPPIKYIIYVFLFAISFYFIDKIIK